MDMAKMKILPPSPALPTMKRKEVKTGAARRRRPAAKEIRTTREETTAGRDRK